jgi:SAM-dependent methyltransferase
MTAVILDIGCGKKKQAPEAIGVDRERGSRADVFAELTRFPWPFRDDCADRIYLSHFLEHQPDILRAMREVHRIAKNGAEVIVVTPHYSSLDSYADPTHLYHLGWQSFDYFTQREFANFTYRSGGFEILERRLTFGGNFLLDNIARGSAALSMDFYEKHLAWMLPARNIYCRLRAVK